MSNTRWVINTESCASQISPWAAFEAIGGPQETTVTMKDAFHARRDLIVKSLNDVPGVHCRLPGGAFYARPNVVAVLSDIHFGAKVPGDGEHVRFSYAASREMITEGVRRMRDFIVRNTD